jgi:hypothetical protein
MGEGATRGTLVLSRTWRDEGSELAFVTRALAGAASRRSAITVVVPGLEERTDPDGAFDITPAGGSPTEWPTFPATSWSAQLPAKLSVIVDEPEPQVMALCDHLPGKPPVHTVLSREQQGDNRALRFSALPGHQPVGYVGMHVPVNPLAAAHRHAGFGFTDYVLVLSDRGAGAVPVPPAGAVAWLTARFPGAEVVAVENATAASWRGRALRGVVPVYTRTDLWRLMAHALVTIDLAPGPVLARECIESLRFGTPVIVPSASAGAVHARNGGGFVFDGIADLLSSVERVTDPAQRDMLSARGRTYADAAYGDQDAFLRAVDRVLGSSGQP